MTREDYLKIYTDASYARVVNQIFNDHEAQIKAQDEILDKLHKAYAESEYECKAKDEEIERLKAQCEQWRKDFLEC